MAASELTDIFNQMADVMEILGEDRFRINSTRRIARVIKDSGADIAALVKQEKLQELSGVGKASAEKIKEYVETGSIGVHQELLGRIPSGLLEMLRIPGMGPKGVAALWKGLKVESVADLREAIEAGRVEQLAGFGAKKAETFLKGISFLENLGNRIQLHHALAIAEIIAEGLRTVEGVNRLEFAGSLRRSCETIGDIDLLVQAKEGKEIAKRFCELDGVEEVLQSGQKKCSIRYKNRRICPEGVQVDLRIIPPESMGAAWQYFTGSKAHNVRLRELAKSKKLKLNEYGLFRGDKQIAGKTEKEIYTKLGLQYVPPTLREDRGEVEAALKQKLPKLIELPHIRGDMHMHTPASDGRDSIEDLVEAARGLGYEYITITDHSKSSVIANGLDVKRLKTHVQRLRRINEERSDMTILAGAEVDILTDGSMDYPDEVLRELDFVVASVHSGMTGDAERNTQRVLNAINNPYVNCIGHPTGRRINQREPMKLDMAKVVEQAARTHTALEISASPHRLDLNDIHCRMAVEAGVKFFINTDAHDAAGLGQMMYGIATAQRGWVKKNDVLNTRSVDEIRDWVAKNVLIQGKGNPPWGDLNKRWRRLFLGEKSVRMRWAPAWMRRVRFFGVRVCRWISSVARPIAIAPRWRACRISPGP
ncbi:MAG: DNA polymerase/3'-5' exonuclease PolX, partial [Planctomycetes bacterium]|nr:DNA polymerase/3'-5' exonuclease PolX [Planctomycetota bacterium]